MKKILIVEDNVEIIELIRDLLVSQGYEVISSMDSYQGIEFAHKEKPDLILLDLMLPAGGGFSMLNNIRLSTKTKDIPVIVLTASRDEEHKEKAKEFGVKVYLEKPYDSKELLAEVHKLLREQE